ncbi:hypothetical protein C8F01DRAFT_1365637 [Mycena amicta]|nr:hypothetical protein C8F01DRAFT_1365637 [Mycena amicta]
MAIVNLEDRVWETLQEILAETEAACIDTGCTVKIFAEALGKALEKHEIEMNRQEIHAFFFGPQTPVAVGAHNILSGRDPRRQVAKEWVRRFVRENISSHQAAAVVNAIRAGKSIHGAAAKQCGARIVADAAAIGLDVGFDVIGPAVNGLRNGQAGGQIADDVVKNISITAAKNIIGGVVEESLGKAAQKAIRKQITSQTARTLSKTLSNKAIYGAAAKNHASKVLGSAAGGVGLSVVVVATRDAIGIVKGTTTPSQLVENAAKESVRSVCMTAGTAVGSAFIPIPFVGSGLGAMVGGFVGFVMTA